MTRLPRWTSVFNFDRNSSTFLVVPLLLVVSLLISSLLDFVVCLSLNTVVLVLRRLSRWCSSSFSKKMGLELMVGMKIFYFCGDFLGIAAFF